MEDHDYSDYRRAQLALAELKAAVRSVVSRRHDCGATNAEVGRTLGIYHGHVGHEGHVSRTILGMLEGEGVVFQSPETKRWFLRDNGLSDEA